MTSTLLGLFGMNPTMEKGSAMTLQGFYRDISDYSKGRYPQGFASGVSSNGMHDDLAGSAL